MRLYKNHSKNGYFGTNENYIKEKKNKTKKTSLILLYEVFTGT